MFSARRWAIAVGAAATCVAPALSMDLNIDTLAKYRAEALLQVGEALSKMDTLNAGAVTWTIGKEGKVVACQVTKTSGDKKADESVEALIRSQTFAPIPWACDEAECSVILGEPLPFNIPSPHIKGLRMSGGESVNATCGKQKISIGSGSSVTGGTISIGGGKDEKSDK